MVYEKIDLALAIFITKPIPYIEEFFNYLTALNLNEFKTHLFIFNNQKINKNLVIFF